MLKLHKDDILRIPKRNVCDEIELDKYNKFNYWKFFEMTYDKNTSINIKSSNIKLENISEFLDYIENLKYNYNGNLYTNFKKEIIEQFLIKLNQDQKIKIQEINTEVFNLKKDRINILKLYFNCISNVYNEKTYDTYDNKLYEILLPLCNNLIEIINNIKIKNVQEIIKINLQIDKYLENVPEIFKNDILLPVLHKSFESQVISCFEIDFEKTFDIVFKWDSLYNKIVIYASKLLSSRIVNKIYDNLSDNILKEQYLNSNLAIKFFKFFKLLNNSKKDFKCNFDSSSANENGISLTNSYRYNKILEDNPTLLSYLIASIHKLISSDATLILEFLRFQKENLNQVDFLANYKGYLQKRLYYAANIEKEQVFIKELYNIFDNSLVNYIDSINNCLLDYKVSAHINDEIKNLGIQVKNPIYKDIEYDIKKLNVSILSNILWNSFRSYNISYDPEIPNNIGIYTTIVKKYYQKKYNKRNLYISHDDSILTVKIRNVTLKLPFSNYYVLKAINKFNSKFYEKEHENTENFTKMIASYLNIPHDHTKNIIFNLVNSDIIIPCNLNNNYKFNTSTFEKAKKIDLTKKIEIKEENIEKEKEYCKEELIDCHLIKIVKKESVSFTKYLFSLRKELKNLFVPNDNMIKERLKRMIKLGYINIKDDKYEYIV